MSKDVIVAFNAGSSNIKCSIFDSNSLELLKHIRAESITEIIEYIASRTDINPIIAGHRVAHAGNLYTESVILTDEVYNNLMSISHLAPLHLPYNLAIVRNVSVRWPNLKQVACFDTTFHLSTPDIEKHFPLPLTFFESGVKRYGFHGLSYEYIASILPTVLGDKANGKIIVAHLGNGSSMCAMQNLESTAITMGFSTLDGLMMGTRCGSIDPGVVLYCQEYLKMTIPEITELLYHKSGLMGVSNLSNDMHKLEASSDSRARLSIDLYVYTILKHLGALMMALGGMDALVFTGGIGENSALVRQKICSKLSWLDIKIDASSNKNNSVVVSSDHSLIPVCVIPTDEESVIAKACKNLSKHFHNPINV